jgi:hypothetical protein
MLFLNSAGALRLIMAVHVNGTSRSISPVLFEAVPFFFGVSVPSAYLAKKCEDCIDRMCASGRTYRTYEQQGAVKIKQARLCLTVASGFYCGVAVEWVCVEAPLNKFSSSP